MKKQYITPASSVLDVEMEAILAASDSNYDSKMADEGDGWLGTDATSKENTFDLDEE